MPMQRYIHSDSMDTAAVSCLWEVLFLMMLLIIISWSPNQLQSDQTGSQGNQGENRLWCHSF